jgi:Holliday junction resolvase-like predicted endonuclease
LIQLKSSELSLVLIRGEIKLDELITSMKRKMIKEISSWEKTKNLSLLISMLRNRNNYISPGSYRDIDENDIFDLSFLIFKYSKGTKIATYETFANVSAKLSFIRLAESRAPSTEYTQYNGVFTDIHMIYLFHTLFEGFSVSLNEKFGFDESVLMLMYLFIGQNDSNLFTMDKIESFLKRNIIENQDIALKMLEKYINYFSIQESELDLSSQRSFIKQIQQKPFIKLDNTQTFYSDYYFNRDNLIPNFHYLLAKDEEYKTNKGSLLEELTKYIFEFSLPEASIYKNLTYKNGEIDLIIETDTKIILVECKSGFLYNDYKLEGLTKNTERNLNSIILKAAQQLNRAKDYIVENGNFRYKGEPIHFSNEKEILLLNICFELPVGFANKLENSNVLSLPIGDLMIIVDELRDPIISHNPRTQELDEYIKLRTKLLGFLTDSELTIMISILYNPHFKILLKHKSTTELNSDKSLARINQLYTILLHALLDDESDEYKLVKNNYKGVLRNLIFDFEE